MIKFISLHCLKVLKNISGFIICLYPSQHPQGAMTGMTVVVTCESKTQRNEGCSWLPEICHATLGFILIPPSPLEVSPGLEDSQLVRGATFLNTSDECGTSRSESAWPTGSQLSLSFSFLICKMGTGQFLFL